MNRKRISRNTVFTLLLALMMVTSGCSNVFLHNDEETTTEQVTTDVSFEATSEAPTEVDTLTTTNTDVTDAQKDTTESETHESASQESNDTEHVPTPTESEPSDMAVPEETASDQPTSDGLLTSASDLNLTPADNEGKNYTFTYDGAQYQAIHTTDHWKIKNSYNITNEADMLIICQALIDLHPIHGNDMVSYRTADDMVYEWQVHNIAYALLSDDDSMKPHVRDVDFDPEDQGRSFDEIYEAHTGKEFDLNKILGR